MSKNSALRAKLARVATVTLEVEPETEPVRGSFGYGSPEEDRAAEDAVLAALADGQEWAWCVVTIRAEYAGLVGTDVLGACSYASERAFREDGHYGEMVDAAIAELAERVLEVREALAALGDEE